jgi:hypothetical protein
MNQYYEENVTDPHDGQGATCKEMPPRKES